MWGGRVGRDREYSINTCCVTISSCSEHYPGSYVATTVVTVLSQCTAAETPNSNFTETW